MMMRTLIISGIFSFCGVVALLGNAQAGNSLGEENGSGKPRLLGYATSSGSLGIENIVHRLGVVKSADGGRRFAFCPEITYHKVPLSVSESNVRAALKAAEDNDLPVIFKLVGNRYWDDRPDLWNWWAPDQPGYNPKNIENVEWYGWGKKCATKMSWVKWGRGRFIPLPPNPNLASPAYIQADKEKLDVLLPIIARWYRDLPSNRKHLLGAVLFGWELQADHVGSFFKGYESDDFYTWIKRKEEERPETMDEYLQLGFSAATTLKLQRCKGEQLQDQSVAAIMHYYFQRLSDFAVAYGIPADRIVLHGVGTGIKNHGVLLSPDSPVIPGWTTYNAQPHDFDYIIDSRGDRPWAAAEFGGYFDLNRLNYYVRRNCSHIVLYARNGHQVAENNRTVRQWLGYEARRGDLVALPCHEGFETGSGDWVSTLGQGPAVRSNRVASKGQWSMHTGANTASDWVLFDEPRAAVVEFDLLDMAKDHGRAGLVDFRADGESCLRLATLGGDCWKYKTVEAGKYGQGPKRREGWRHVKAVFDGTCCRVYMDGELVVTDPKLGKVRELTVGWYWQNSTGFDWDEFDVRAFTGNTGD
jgi:hypothetical protein